MRLETDMCGRQGVTRVTAHGEDEEAKARHDVDGVSVLIDVSVCYSLAEPLLPLRSGRLRGARKRLLHRQVTADVEFGYNLGLAFG